MATTAKRSLLGRAGAAARKVVAKKAAPEQKAAAKKVATKAPVKKAAPAAKQTATKAPAKKAAPAAKKAPAKRATTTKAAPAAKKAPAKKASVTKAAPAAKKAPVKKATTTKAAPAAKKAPAKKAAPAATKATATKAAPAAKKTTTKAAPAVKKAPASKATAAAKKTVARKAASASASSLVVLEQEDPWSKGELAEVKAQLEADVERLTVELQEVEGDLNVLMRDAGEGAGSDQADVGSATFERDQEMTIVNNARDMLLQSQRALERIEKGTYGVCELCGNPIGKNRLMAFPRATLCMDCKRREERR